ncbi:MAG: EAL domain-containing protein [Clostridiaceae bacterium]|jgi:diguanylate cyclase (GGDEF)-like protein/PAS domain S-box-containing protein|nr:EAL domain-containing protein [Clostridiaceae bacterium]
MDLVSIVLTLVLIIYCSLLIHILRFRIKLYLTRLFTLSYVSIIIWVISNIFIIYSKTNELSMIWYKISTVSQSFFSAFILHFYILFTGRSAFFDKCRNRILFYVPHCVLVIAFFTRDLIIKEFVFDNLGQKSITIIIDYWLCYYLLVHFCYLTAVVIILLLWKSELKYRFEKKQSTIIIVPYTVSLLLGFYSGVFAILLNSFQWLMIIPAAAVFGTISAWYATLKYKLMVLTPSVAAEKILSTLADSVILVDSDLKILSVNNETVRLLGYKEEELAGKDIVCLFAEDQNPDINITAELLKNGTVRNLETHFLASDGSIIPISFSASEYRDENNALVGYIIVSRDITDKKTAEKTLKHIAQHDYLTNLPNRYTINLTLKNAIEKAAIDDSIVAVILLNIDRFKVINDTYGHDTGDKILIEAAKRLKASIRYTDVIARLGNDEFLCVIENVVSIDDVNKVIAKLQKAFEGKYKIGSNELSITASMGVSIFPRDGKNVGILIKNADIAMYHAKSKGKNKCQFYSLSLGMERSKKLLLENNLHNAVENNEFVVYYQPIVDVNTGRIISIEALVRWLHPKFGLISPMEFIPIAEETGHIIKIGEYVMRTACRQNSQWIRMGLSSVPVSVNLSPIQFQQPDLVDMVIDILRETGLQSCYLQLEITESAAMADTNMVISLLNRLNEIGITLIVDDFGIGYSSLNYLKKFPISMIKIDKLFVRNIAEDQNDVSVIYALFAMAHALDLKVVAEGVETREQLEVLRSLEFKTFKKFKTFGVQGYYFSKPVPAEIFADLLKSQQKKLFK